MAKTYATPADVAAILGRPLTTEETARVTPLLEAATVAFDQETGQSFEDATPVVGEARTARGGDLWLWRYPVATVEAVRARAGWIGASTDTLVAGQSYDLIDAAAGRLRVSGWASVGTCGPWSAGEVFYAVDYTPALVPVPLDVADAVAQWASAWLAPTSNPGQAGVEQVSVALGELAMRFRDPSASATATAGIPPTVAPVIARYRRQVWA
jgi:hypothetical protein